MFSLSFLTFLTTKSPKACVFIDFFDFFDFFRPPRLWQALGWRLAEPEPLKVPRTLKSQKSQKSQWKHSFLVISSQKRQKSQWKHMLFAAIDQFPLVLLRFSVLFKNIAWFWCWCLGFHHIFKLRPLPQTFIWQHDGLKGCCMYGNAAPMLRGTV